MAQNIGLDAKFNTRQFSRGLNVYLRGLTKARQETLKTAASINSATRQIQASWQQASAAPSVALLALQRLTSAINTMGTAILSTGQSLNTFSAAFGGLAATTNQLSGRINTLSTRYNKTNKSILDYVQNTSRATLASLSMATAIGGVLILAFRRLSISIRNIISEGIDLVRFYERSQLALQYFAARSDRAADSALSLNSALDQNAKTSEGLLIWLQKLAIESPFTSKDVIQSFRVAQAYGLLAEDAKTLIPLLLDLGSAVGLEAETLENAARALGQIQARGKLTGEEIRQLGNAGIPIRDILIKQLGIAASEFDPLLEAGAITANVTIPAIVESLREFEGAGERIAFTTITGMISAFKELKQVGTARFFQGIFEPLQEGILSLVQAANDLETIAWFKILGVEVGNFIKNSVESLIKGVQNLIKTWQELDPTIKQTIITFASSVVVFTATAAAIGAMTLAVRLLVRPFTIAITLLAALNTAWQLDIRNFQTGSRNVIQNFRDFGSSMTNVITTIIGAFGDMFGAIGGFFNDFIELVGGWGVQLVSVFASGLESFGPIIRAFTRMNALFAYWMKPGSPSRVSGPIDRYGYDTMGVYASGLEKGVEQIYVPMYSIGGVISDATSDALNDANLSEQGFGAGEELVDGWYKALNIPLIGSLSPYWRGLMEKYKTDAEAPVTQAGSDVADMFWEGWAKSFPKPLPTVNKEVADILSQIGPGARLSTAGAEAINQYLSGFEDADYSALNQIAGIVSSRLSSLSKIGEIGELDVPFTLSKTREALASAIDEFRTFGNVSKDTLSSIQNAAGPAGDATVSYLNKYFKLATASSKTKAAQDALNDSVEYYKNLIDPIQRQLDALQKATSEFSEQREIVRLTRVVNDYAASELRRAEAAARIEEIRTRQRLRNVEEERDTTLKAGQDELDARKKVEEGLSGDLDLLTSRLNLQNSQLDAVSDEASLLNALNDKLERAMKKQTSELEKQISFSKLLNEEERDRLDEARARYILSSNESTEFEKQQAALELQTIELNRQRRDLEAVDLGFDPARFQPIRDAVITLDDLNIKAKDTGNSFDDMFDKILGSDDNAEVFADEWEAALETVRLKYEAIRTEYNTTLARINETLPDFLKLFPKEEGGEPPIIKNLRRMQFWIFAVGIAFAGSGILIRLAALKNAIVALGGTTVLRAISSMGTRLVTVLEVGGAALGAFTGIVTVGVLSWITNFLNFRTRVSEYIGGFVRDLINAAEILVNFTKLAAEVGKVLLPGKAGSDARQRLREGYQELKQTIDQEGFSGLFSEINLQDELSDVFNDFEQGATDSAVPNIFSGLANVINEQLGDVVNGTDTDTFSNEITSKIDESMSNESDRIAGILANLFSNKEFENQAIEEAGLVGQDLSQGVINGLILDKIAAEDAITNWTNDFFNTLRSDLGIKSPSTLAAKLVGQPIAEGIVEGIKEFLKEGTSEDSVDETFSNIQSAASDSNKELVDGARQFNTLFGIRMQDLKTLVINTWGSVVESTELSWTTLSNFILTSVATLTETIPESLSALEGAIVGVFEQIKEGSSEEVKNLVIDVEDLLVYNEDSLVNSLDSLLNGKEGAGYKLGIGFMTGIADGINDPVSWSTVMIPALTAFAQNTISELQSLWQIDSPSKVTARLIGVPFVEGIAAGIEAGSPLLSYAVQNALTSGVDGLISSQLSPSAGASNNNFINNTSREYHYNLNVETRAQSQGVINDFSIMKVLAA